MLQSMVLSENGARHLETTAARGRRAPTEASLRPHVFVKPCDICVRASAARRSETASRTPPSSSAPSVRFARGTSPPRRFVARAPQWRPRRRRTPAQTQTRRARSRPRRRRARERDLARAREGRRAGAKPRGTRRGVTQSVAAETRRGGGEGVQDGRGSEESNGGEGNAIGGRALDVPGRRRPEEKPGEGAAGERDAAPTRVNESGRGREAVADGATMRGYETRARSAARGARDATMNIIHAPSPRILFKRLQTHPVGPSVDVVHRPNVGGCDCPLVPHLPRSDASPTVRFDGLSRGAWTSARRGK